MMDERIKKLAKQADIACGATADNTAVMYGWEETFAKLIIQECCDIVNERTQHNNEHDSLHVLAIKEHFGVE
jgi:hypothetical protein